MLRRMFRQDFSLIYGMILQEADISSARLLSGSPTAAGSERAQETDFSTMFSVMKTI